jgi:hypothetical protein
LAIISDLKTIRATRLIMEGWSLYYNHFRTHPDLRGKTPGQAAGVAFQYKDWLEMIQTQLNKK